MIAKTLLRVCTLLLLMSAPVLYRAGRVAVAAPPRQEAPPTLAYGQTVDGAITPASPSQRYTFGAQANDVVTITMTTHSAELDPFVTLMDAAGVQLATDDDSGGETNARLAFVIPASGRYGIEVSHAGGLLTTSGGPYSLTLTAVGEDGVIVERVETPDPAPGPGSPPRPEVAPDPQGEVARLLPITPGVPVEGDLTRQVAFRLYWFESDASRPISLTATGAEAFTPRLTLYDNQFEEVARAQPGQPLEIQPAAPGVFFAGVSLPEAGASGGHYTLTLGADSAASPDESAAAAPAPESEAPPQLPGDFAGLPSLAPGEPVEGTLDDQQPMEIYTFLGAAGQTATIEMNSLNPAESSGLDPFVLLLDAERIPLAEDDDIVDGVERDARLVYTLPRTAYYAVVATRFDQEAGTSAGPYRLTLSLAPAGGAAEPPIPLLISEPLVPNTPVQALYDGTPDTFHFEAQAGELIDLSITADPGLDPVLILTTGTLREIVSSGTGTLTALRTPAAGTYYLIVTTRFGPAGPSGGYILALNQPGERAATSGSEDPAGAPDLAVEPQPLAYGQTLSGIIDDQTPSQLYDFSGRTGERIRLTLRAAAGSALDPYLELRDAAGAVIDANDDIDPGIIRDAQIITSLPADGAYQVLVSRYVGPDADLTAGAYELMLEQVAGDTAAQMPANRAIIPLRYGQTQIGEITNEQYLLFYVFTGAAGDVVTIEVDQLSGNVDAVLHLYQAAGERWTQIAYNDDSPIGGTYDPLLSAVTLPSSGPYLIAVGRYGLDKETGMVGTFSITLTQQP